MNKLLHYRQGLERLRSVIELNREVRERNSLTMREDLWHPNLTSADRHGVERAMEDLLWGLSELCVGTQMDRKFCVVLVQYVQNYLLWNVPIRSNPQVWHHYRNHTMEAEAHLDWQPQPFANLQQLLEGELTTDRIAYFKLTIS